MLQYSRARIDPISLVDIGDVVELADDGIVYMAANHDIGALLAGLVHDSFFKGGDELTALFTSSLLHCEKD